LVLLEAEEIFVLGNEVSGLRCLRAGNDHIIVWVSHYTADDWGSETKWTAARLPATP